MVDGPGATRRFGRSPSAYSCDLRRPLCAPYSAQPARRTHVVVAGNREQEREVERGGLVSLTSVTMNDWKAPVGRSAGGGSRNYGGPNGTAEKVDYSRLPNEAGPGDDGEGDDWIQRQIRGHKVSSKASVGSR